MQWEQWELLIRTVVVKIRENRKGVEAYAVSSGRQDTGARLNTQKVRIKRNYFKPLEVPSPQNRTRGSRGPRCPTEAGEDADCASVTYAHSLTNPLQSGHSPPLGPVPPLRH